MNTDIEYLLVGVMCLIIWVFGLFVGIEIGSSKIENKLCKNEPVELTCKTTTTKKLNEKLQNSN